MRWHNEIVAGRKVYNTSGKASGALCRAASAEQNTERMKFSRLRAQLACYGDHILTLALGCMSGLTGLIE